MGKEAEKWSSIEEVAEHIQVHKDTIRNWIRDGKIPAHKIGKQWRFRLSEIDKWIESGKSAE